MIAIGFFNQSLEPVQAATVSDMARRGVTATAIGILLASSSLLGSISPVVAGVVADAKGFQSTFLLVSAVAFLGAFIALFLRIPGGMSVQGSESGEAL